MCLSFFFFFNDTATTEIYTLSLHDALPIYVARTLDLANAALSFAVRALRRDGRFLVKVFQGDGYREFVRRVGERFEAVKGVKPTASSATSAEIYVLAVGRL